MIYMRKYATATTTGTNICIPLLKAGSDDFALTADWTPATGDVKVSIDGGAFANVGTLPAWIAGGLWSFVFTTGETTGKSIRVLIQDAATKAVQDDGFILETFGNASAMWPDDLSVASATAPTNWALFSIDASGRIDVGKILGTASAGAAGYVGLDWAHITAPTTTQALTGTTLSTSQVVASVTGAVGSVTGAVASVTGAVGSVTGNVGGNVVGSVGSVTGNVGGNVVGSVASVAGAVASVTGNVGGSVASVTAVVSANVTKINSVTVTGAGTALSPWGP